MWASLGYTIPIDPQLSTVPSNVENLTLPSFKTLVESEKWVKTL